MPDAPAGQSVVAQAQELGADVLARLDELTRQTQEQASEVSAVSLEQRKKLAQEAIDKMNAIVEHFITTVRSQETAAQQERAAADLAEIEKLRASITQ